MIQIINIVVDLLGFSIVSKSSVLDAWFLSSWYLRACCGVDAAPLVPQVSQSGMHAAVCRVNAEIVERAHQYHDLTV